MHKLTLIKLGKKPIDITKYCNSIAWSSELNALSTQLSFDYIYSDMTEIKKFDLISLGDYIVLTNGNTKINTYIVTSEGYNGRFSKTITCNDYGWYLNKSKVIMQFNKINGSSAIAKTLDKFNIKHDIASLGTIINKIYKDQTVSGIIDDIIEQATQETGKKYYYEIINDTFILFDRATKVLKNITVDLGYTKVNVLDNIANPSHSKSIEDMKNSVLVVSSNEKSTKIIVSAKDTNSINKYGLLQEILVAEDKKEAQSRNIANNTLKDLNRITEDISLELIGSDEIVSGRMIVINEPVTKIQGTYLIKSANHTLNNGIHRVSVQLGVA